MKLKKVALSLISIILLSTVVSIANPISISAFINPEFRYNFDGMNKDLPQEYESIIYNNRSYVPARFVAENLGAEVQFNSNNKTIYFVSKEGKATSDLENYISKIEMLEKKVNDLERQLEEAKKVSQVNYSKLPLTQNLRDYSVTVQDLFIDQSSRFSKLYVSVENTDRFNFINLSPLRTTIIHNGREYTASTIDTDLNLFQAISRNNRIQGGITFEDLPKDMNEFIIKVTIIENEGFRENERVLQFNAKLN